MLPSNIKSAFSLFQIPKLLSQQDQLLLLAQQTQQQIEQQQQQSSQIKQQQQQSSQQQIKLQQQQQQQQTFQIQKSPATITAPIISQPQSQTIQHQSIQGLNPIQNAAASQQLNIDLELFNQNLFYQAVFAGKDLESHLDAVLKKKQKLENLIDYFAGFQFPNFIKLIGTITLSSLQRTMEQGDLTIINELIENPMKIILKESVWKLVTQIINKKQFQYEDKIQDNYYKELSQMLIFKQEVAEMIFSFFADKQNMITLGSLNNFYQMLQSSSNNQVEVQGNNKAAEAQRRTLAQQKSNEIYGNLCFQQFGGQIYKISRQSFHDQFDASINQLVSYFEKQNTIVCFIKRSSRSKLNFREDELLQSYLKLMGDFKQTNLKNFLNNLCNDIFEQNESIEKHNFLSKVNSIHSNTNSKIVFTLLEIIRIELDLVHQEEFIQFFLKNVNFNQELQTGANQPNGQASNNSNESSNYYLKTIDKLLNKCVFNGDEKCDCKKCQCIRRNRNSAKESQKKKREALQQIGPLLEKQELLEKKIQELESENTILKNIITQISNYTNVQEIFQPISKIISYQLKEEDEPSNHDLSEVEGAKPSKKICTNNSKEGSSCSLEIQNNRSQSATISVQSKLQNLNELQQQ
ncbi:hypothetical protein ABPG74_010720 [Tetrahymena malaccensis]